MISLVFLASCATGTKCKKLNVEKERKACYDEIARQQEEIWMNRDYGRRF